MNTEVVVKEKAPLDELMLAMDVVDTLRHKELVLARELTAEDRDAKLLDQLREIYTSQGIAVTDEILQRGVDALREERFVYPQPEPSFSRTLAYAYVTRGRWGKWAGGGVALLAVAALSFQLFVRGPELRQATEVPAELTAAFATLDANTDDAAALDAARAELATGQAAVAQGDFAAARAAAGAIATLNARVQAQYELRIVSRPGEHERRVARAGGQSRRAQLLPDRRSRSPRTARRCGCRSRARKTAARAACGPWVCASTRRRTSAPWPTSSDDGIIQNNVVGRKRRGVLEREYTVPTTGAAITDW